MSQTQQTIREIIDQLENEFILAKTFHDQDGKPKFITDLDIQKRCPSLQTNEILASLRALPDKEFMKFNNIPTGYYFDGKGDDIPVTMIVRSRIFHTVMCITQTEVITGNTRQRNVGDWRYIRNIKKVSKRDHSLHQIHQDNSHVAKILGGPMKFFTDLLDYLMHNSKYTGISNFQKNCAISTLERLINKTAPQGLAFVAGTGQGKSFAFQLPLLIWILYKKLDNYDKLVRNKIKSEELPVNCSSLLIFPRKTLANDQNESLVELIDIINNYIEKAANIADRRKREFIKIKKPLRDHTGGDSGASRLYNEKQDIIITTPQSLENRLGDPDCSSLYSGGIDIILYDEVHLHKGISGAEITALNVRLQNFMSTTKPLFIGMSATIDKPDIHCQKLFGLITTNQRPPIIEEDPNEPLIDFTIEHHLMLKPAAGRVGAGVAMETTSCLLHNRREEGFAALHDDPGGRTQPRTVDPKEKPKTITFINSLDGSGSYVKAINDYENYFGKNKFGGTGGNSTPRPANRLPERGYYYYCRPKQGQSFSAQNNPQYSESCDDCINRITPDVLDCEYYRTGQCWYFSQDDSNQFNQTRYQPVAHPTNGRPPTWMPFDNIRSKRSSSKDHTPSNLYNYFLDTKSVLDRDPNPIDNRRQPRTADNIQIDNVVATPTLEVGVDFDNIQEIIQFGTINSASSYKQKAGRGAREGNTRNGLFVMSIIDTSPASYFHFKHFDRLITSTLDPIRLEVLNDNVVFTHLFRSVFDFFAREGIKIFRIRESSSSRLDQNEINNEYANATRLLDSKPLKKFLESFIEKIGYQNTHAVEEVINYAKRFVCEMSKEFDLTIRNVTEKRTLHDWLVRAAEHSNVLDQVSKKYRTDDLVDEKKKNIIAKLKTIEQNFNTLYPNDNAIQQSIDSIKGEIENG